MISVQARDAFWMAVEDCLVEIHHLARGEARKRAGDLRADLGQPPPGLDVDEEAIYHAEPFDVACDLAGQPLDLAQYRAQYEPILNRHNW